MHPVRVPATVTVKRLEVVVSFPSGPLAGEITGWTPVEVKGAGPVGKK